ncbi:hypothetical protein [Bradyrhizobium sp. JYMT SZCCT0180]|uniref:hypothetical protein n=1 Tax=Bradyrhizobium sp. JYMT SZCCT0180 TaxID=2807666 RepID=UPI001BA55639|nr:hypothetical protein [Bradyrhizobium sp. JYMT SZCCT0180]MBR1213478.1 hypothetical protein [Bradyrhizobium sp. JYMT SZCCT0180]
MTEKPLGDSDLWEVVTYSARTRTSRMKVPGGWLLLIERSDRTLTSFLADPGYKWEIVIPPAQGDAFWSFRFLHLTNSDKRPVQVNIGEIALIEQASDASTKITLKAGGPTVTVSETQQDIITLLRDLHGQH